MTEDNWNSSVEEMAFERQIVFNFSDSCDWGNSVPGKPSTNQKMVSPDHNIKQS